MKKKQITTLVKLRGIGSAEEDDNGAITAYPAVFSSFFPVSDIC